jgi:hypothetical protein
MMRSAISALAGFALAGSFVFAQPSDGRLKIIHVELCERIARSLEAQLNVGLTIKWVPG